MITKGFSHIPQLLRYLAISGYLSWSKYGDTVNEGIKKITKWPNAVTHIIQALSKSLADLADIHQQIGKEDDFFTSLLLQRQAIQWMAMDKHLKDLSSEYTTGFKVINIMTNIFDIRIKINEIEGRMPAIDDDQVFTKLDLRFILKTNESPQEKAAKIAIDQIKENKKNDYIKDKKVKQDQDIKQSVYPPFYYRPRGGSRGRPRGRPRGGSRGRGYSKYGKRDRDYDDYQQHYNNNNYNNNNYTSHYPPLPAPYQYAAAPRPQPIPSPYQQYPGAPQVQQQQPQHNPINQPPAKRIKQEPRGKGAAGDKAKGYDPLLDKNRVYHYDGDIIYGNESLIRFICRFFEEGSCRSPNHWDCQFHHMCRWCFVVGKHRGCDCGKKKSGKV